jgi:hypothetical protein
MTGALWDGTAVWDGSRTWGFDTLPPDVVTERSFIGAGIPKRGACFQLYSVNPTTLVFETELPLRERGGHRTVSARQRMQQDSLEFTLNDPTHRYLYGGDLYNLVDLNSLVGLKWTVTNTSTGSVTYYGNIYRVEETPDQTEDETGTGPLTFNANDWLRAPLNIDAVYIGGQTPLREAILLKDAMVALGCPVIGTSNSWATVAGAILYYLAGERLRVTGDWVSMEHPTGDALIDMLDPLTVEPLSRAASWWDVFNWLAWFANVQGFYDADGWPHIRQKTGRIDSGLVFACDPDTLGRVQLPWEHPVQRTIVKPEFTAFDYYITYLENNTSVVIEYLAGTISNAQRNPHAPPATKGRVEVARGNFVHNAVDQTAQQYVEMILHEKLAAADTLTVPMDSAIPMSSYIGQEIYAALEDMAITGWFTLNEINQPLDERPQTLIMNWAADY